MARPAGGYRVGGKPVPSVTTITADDCGGLTYWAHRLGVQLGEAQWQHHRGEIDDEGLEAAKAQYTLAGARRGALDAGTVAHHLIEASLLGEELRFDASEVGMIVWEHAQTAKAAFDRWWQRAGLEIVMTELQLTCEEMRFGGTFDVLCRDEEGRLVLVDWKAAKAIYPPYLMQIAAYGILARDHYDEPIHAYELVQLGKDEARFKHVSYLAADPVMQAAERAFLLRRRLYDEVRVLKEACR